MPKTTIRIDYPEYQMVANARRVGAAKSLKPMDRTSVLVGAYERYFLVERGVSYGELYSGPESYLYHKIMNQVWAIQNIPDDRCQTPGITICMDFENAADASAFGAVVEFDDQLMPWTRPILNSPDDVDRLEIPCPDAGLWGKLLAWYEIMLDRLSDYRLLFNGREAPITILPPHPGGEGPFTIAFQLAGTNLHLWCALYPDTVHTLMQKITAGLIQQHRFVRQLYPHPRRESFGVISDSAELLSPDMYREFCVPYHKQLYDALGDGIQDSRSMHNCGQVSHLLPIFLEEEHITSLWGFGSRVEPEVVAALAGGHCWVRGNIDPILLLEASPDEVERAATRVLAAFGSYGGLILADGFNIAPGTPLENIAALVRASERWGPVEPAAGDQ